MQRERSSANAKAKQSLVLDANILFDLHHAGILLLIFGLDYTFITVDLVENELKSLDSRLLRAAGLRVESLSGQQVAETYKLHAAYRGGPSISDISAFILARDNGFDLATRDSGLWQVASDHNVVVKETHDLIRDLVDAGDLSYKEASDALGRALARLPVQRLDWLDMIKDWRKKTTHQGG